MQRKLGFRSRLKRSKRGVSDVVATILLLALTVTLFASIFAFVTTFPSPPAQNNNQFQAGVTLTPNLTYVQSLKITHLAGPTIAGNAQVFLKSAVQPNAPEFQNPYTVASGLGGSNSWNLGQTWSLTFTSPNLPLASSNITVYIVSASNLIFSVILPGTTLAPAPTIVSTSISPAPPSVGQAFTVYATVSGSYSANSVYVNLAAVPGAPSTPQKMSQNSQGQWTYTLSGGASSNGTFYGFVNVSASTGLTATASVVVAISASGGGSSNGPLSVAVILVPAPPNAGTTESVQAVVTYTGTLSNLALSVSFSGSSSPSGYTFSGVSPSGLTISGPSSVTVVSLSSWTLPNPNSLYTFTVSATATVGTLTPVTGTFSFTPANLGLSAVSGLMGASLTATGQGWSTVTGSTVTLSFGGIAVTPSSCSVGTLAGSTITPSGTGAFSCSITVPNGVPAGATSAVATDALSGQADFYGFTVTSWTLTVGPATGLLGSTATARGLGFAGSSSVTLTFDGISITPSGSTNGTCTFSGATITTTALGAFTCRFVIPYGATAGTATSVATDSTSGQVASYSGSAVTAWTIVLSPTSWAHGSNKNVTITGTGFAASSVVSISFNGVVITPTGCHAGSGTLAGNTITLTAAGGFICYYIVPSTTGAGVYQFTANDATSAQSASGLVQLT